MKAHKRKAVKMKAAHRPRARRSGRANRPAAVRHQRDDQPCLTYLDVISLVAHQSISERLDAWPVEPAAQRNQRGVIISLVPRFFYLKKSKVAGGHLQLHLSETTPCPLRGSGSPSRRHDRHFGWHPLTVSIETPAKGRGGCSRVTVSPTARVAHADRALVVLVQRLLPQASPL